MFSLQNLLHRPDKLISLLEASARQARASVQALVTGTQNVEASAAAEDGAYCRLKDREITETISEEVYHTYIAPLDREDIDTLSNALYKIPKIADKFSERFRNSPEFVRTIDFSRQLNLVDEASDLVVKLVETLQHGLNLEQVKALNDRLHAVEAEADKYMGSLYKDLYSGNYQAVQVILLKDLYELLEKLIDRCRSVGNIIARIALKNA